MTMYGNYGKCPSRKHMVEKVNQGRGLFLNSLAERHEKRWSDYDYER